MIITYSGCVFVALVTQHTMRMRRIIISVGCLVVPHFPTSLLKRYDFRKKILSLKVIFIFSTNPV